MRTIEKLEKHLSEYRLKKVDFPTYEDLVELTRTARVGNDIVAVVADYMAEAKGREARLVKAGYYLGFMDAKSGVDSFFFDSRDEALVYREAGLEEFVW